MNEDHPILIIEDSDEDFEVTCWALRQAGFTRPITRAVRAEDALLHLCPMSPRPDWTSKLPCLVLLDLNLPGMNGQQFLQELRQAGRSPSIPVVILSTSKNPRDIADCYRLGAAGYICKPMSLQLFIEKMRRLIEYWFESVTLAESDG